MRETDRKVAKKAWFFGRPHTEKFDLETFSLNSLYRTFGTANPSLYSNPFYSYMIKEKFSPFDFEIYHDLDYKSYSPMFTFEPRIGMSETSLPSHGFTVFIGGEYEDFYDPHFLIYNDVIVKYDDGTVKHFGYPEDVFPCTDFHTATYYPAHNCIYIIGRLGYFDFWKGNAKKETPVFKLDLQTFEISKIDYEGKSPGWIYDHTDVLRGKKIWVIVRPKDDKGPGPGIKLVYFNVETRKWGKKNLRKKQKLT